MPSSRPSTASSTTSVASLASFGAPVLQGQGQGAQGPSSSAPLAPPTMGGGHAQAHAGAGAGAGAHPVLHRAFTTNDLPVHLAKMTLGSRPGSQQQQQGGIPTVTVSIAGEQQQQQQVQGGGFGGFGGRAIPTTSINLTGGQGAGAGQDAAMEGNPGPSASPDPMDADPSSYPYGGGAGGEQGPPAMLQAYGGRAASAGLPRPQAHVVQGKENMGMMPAKLQAMASLGGIVLGNQGQGQQMAVDGGAAANGYVPRAL